MKKWAPVLWVIFLLVFQASLFGEEENILLVRTQEAEYDEKTGKIVARDAVLTWRNLEILCPSLEVDTRSQEVRTSGDIKAFWGDFETHMESLFYSRKTNTLLASLLSGKGKDLTFVTEKGLFDFEKGIAVFTGNPKLSVQGFEVALSQAEYLFEEKAWRGKGVVVAREGWRGRAKEARYVEGSNLLVLEGEAEIEREGNLLRGERISVTLDTLQVKVEGNVEIFLLPPRGGE